MKSIIILIITLFSFQTSTIKGNNTDYPNRQKDKIIVYIFLHDACLISQYYTLPLREIHKNFSNEHIQFIGLFPNSNSTSNKINAFKEKYKIPFELKSDYYHIKKNAFQATVTPEVVVYNESKKEILYQGRIDDAYARVGKRKRFTTTSELKDVLTAIKNNNPITISNTEPVGCFIGKSALK